MALSSAEKVRAYRARQKAKGEPDITQRDKARQEAFRNFDVQKPFTGCDGEGAGTDKLGRQLYLLFRMGDRELFTGEHLRTEEVLDFICDHPGDEILVGFSFGYDVTMILRDVPEKQLRRLVEPKDMGDGKSRYTWFKHFDVEYLPKQYLRVRRMTWTDDGNGNRRRVPAGDARTIFETFGFFQKSFVKVIHEFEIGTPEGRAMIVANKERRGDFVEMTAEERAYCAMECDYLAELMERLREYCHAAAIRPRTWNGAGKLASALHKREKTIRSDSLALSSLPPELTAYANMAYYGGRFEITRTGMINEKVHEYDIRSAYPDAMRFLPCLEHGLWERASGDALANGDLYIAGVSFNHPDNSHGAMCGLPVRSKEGHLYWPNEGAGVYWSPEIRSAEKLGASISLKSGWVYVKQCDCHPFDWVEPLFNYRRQIGSKGPGYPIKLAINSLYGKLAQRRGAGAYANMIWAGLITAFTRAKINEAIAANPGRIIMAATDAVYSLDPLTLDEGEALGQWEGDELDGLFIVQPGLYWCPEKRKRKSRGLPGKFFEENQRTERFENEWSNYLSNGGEDFPSIPVDLTNFIGLKLALSRNNIDSAGRWIAEQRSISFDYRNKRDGHIECDGHIVTAPKRGGPLTISLPHKDFLKAGGAGPWEDARAMLEDQPDYIDLGPPFKD